MQGFVSEEDYTVEDNYALGFSFFGQDRKLVTILALDDQFYTEALKYVELNSILK
jgi:hypothetical protein